MAVQLPDPGLKSSVQTFFRVGGQHAQLLGVLTVFVGAVYLAGSRIKGLSDEADKIRVEMAKEVGILRAQHDTLRAQLDKEAETRRAELDAANARVAQARAEAIQLTSDRFLKFGYAEEYEKYQRQALGDKAPPKAG